MHTCVTKLFRGRPGLGGFAGVFWGFPRIPHAILGYSSVLLQWRLHCDLCL